VPSCSHVDRRARHPLGSNSVIALHKLNHSDRGSVGGDLAHYATDFVAVITHCDDCVCSKVARGFHEALASDVPAVDKQLRVPSNFSPDHRADLRPKIREVVPRAHKKAEHITVNLHNPVSRDVICSDHQQRTRSGWFMILEMLLEQLQ